MALIRWATIGNMSTYIHVALYVLLLLDESAGFSTRM